MKNTTNFKVMDAARAADRRLGSKGGDLLKLYDKVDDWFTGKASKGFAGG